MDFHSSISPVAKISQTWLSGSCFVTEVNMKKCLYIKSSSAGEKPHVFSSLPVFTDRYIKFESRGSTMWGPSVISWLINPINHSYSRIINHTYRSYLHQLSYRWPHIVESSLNFQIWTCRINLTFAGSSCPIDAAKANVRLRTKGSTQITNISSKIHPGCLWTLMG